MYLVWWAFKNRRGWQIGLREVICVYLDKREILIKTLNKIMRINCVNEGNQQPQVRSLEKASSMSLGQKSYDKLN